jgi:predicted DNA-binding protein
MTTARQQSMIRKQILMPSMMAERVKKIARNRGVSFGEVVRDAVDAFDETISHEDADLLDTMADNLIATTNDTIERIDELMKRMHETHAMVMGASHGDRG